MRENEGAHVAIHTVPSTDLVVFHVVHSHIGEAFGALIAEHVVERT